MLSTTTWGLRESQGLKRSSSAFTACTHVHVHVHVHVHAYVYVHVYVYVHAHVRVHTDRSRDLQDRSRDLQDLSRDLQDLSRDLQVAHRIFGGAVHHMHQQSAPLGVAEEGTPQPSPLVRPLEQPGDVSEHL